MERLCLVPWHGSAFCVLVASFRGAEGGSWHGGGAEHVEEGAAPLLAFEEGPLPLGGCEMELGGRGKEKGSGLDGGCPSHISLSVGAPISLAKEAGGWGWRQNISCLELPKGTRGNGAVQGAPPELTCLHAPPSGTPTRGEALGLPRGSRASGDGAPGGTECVCARCCLPRAAGRRGAGCARRELGSGKCFL